MQYQYALERIEDLLPLVNGEDPNEEKSRWSSPSIRISSSNTRRSTSRINDYVSGRAEPSLRIASRLCRALGIAPAAMLGL